MCGIIGVVNHQKKESVRSELEHLIQRLRHRGPDSWGVFSNEKYGVAHSRLSIVDTSSSGKQPFITDDDVVLVCNGEIYNHMDIKREITDAEYHYQSHSDNEKIIPLYLKYKERCVDKLDGMFAFILIHNNEVMVARDPLGIKPLFFCMDDQGAIWFASEQHVLSIKSNDVQMFPPGHYWTEKEGFIRYYRSKWWDFASPVQVPQEKVNLNKIKTLLENAVQKRLMSDVPVGCMLSGGLDSSIITAIASKYHHTKIMTFSVGFENSPDLKYARETAEFLKTDHHELILDYNDDLIKESIDEFMHKMDMNLCDNMLLCDVIPEHILYKYASQYVKVLLVGEGADEIFHGYKHMPYTSDLEIQEGICHGLSGLADFLLLKVDLSSMGHGVEARVPFLDKECLEYFVSIHPSEKKHNNIEKNILRKAFSEYLPKSILYRPKLPGLIGYGEDWLNKLREIILSNKGHDDAKKQSARVDKYGYIQHLHYTNVSLQNKVTFNKYLYPNITKLICSVIDKRLFETYYLNPNAEMKNNIKESIMKIIGNKEIIYWSDELEKNFDDIGLTCVDLTKESGFSFEEIIDSIRVIVFDLNFDASLFLENFVTSYQSSVEYAT